MNEVIKKVPADQLNSATYATMADIQKTIRNSAQEKKYLELYLEKIKAGGGDITDIVSSTQKEIDSL
jgi:cell fate regulator YaaT (PSP1 superfamily)